MAKKVARNGHQTAASQKRRQKRRDHDTDDIIDCKSINEMQYFSEPKEENGKVIKVDPYASLIGSPKTERSESCTSSKLKHAGLSKRIEASTQPKEVITDGIMTKESAKMGKKKRLPKKVVSTTNNAAEWNMFTKWNEYSTSTVQTVSVRARAAVKRQAFAIDFFIHLCRITSNAGSYQGPIGVLLILACLYFSLMYVEISLANSAEIALEWLWPAVHMILRSIERILRSATNFVQSVDEMGESIVCDWAHLWCIQFNLMCHQRCSFTTKTLEKFRQV
uniref:Uncharacterized protein n=1 Tax=Ditylenchus dipsaci TaxID=166011 RepID=A0A915CPL9_9BILA